MHTKVLPQKPPEVPKVKIVFTVALGNDGVCLSPLYVLLWSESYEKDYTVF